VNIPQELRKIEYIIIISALIIIPLALANIGNSEVKFCRSVFNGLIMAKVSVEKHIDWEALRVLDLDVGAVYKKLPNDKEKKDYRLAFIQNFSLGFKKLGSNINMFANWKVYGINNDTVTVSALDQKHKVALYLKISKDAGRRKLVSITRMPDINEK
jgi:hypothetical protein